MTQHLCQPKHGTEDHQSVDDNGAENEGHDGFQGVVLGGFDLGFPSVGCRPLTRPWFGHIALGRQLPDIALGRQLGARHRFGQRIGNPFGLFLGHMGRVTQGSRQFQGVEGNCAHGLVSCIP